MSDTLLRAMMPSYLSKMTDSHMQLCGCETCIMSKNFVHALNKWCTLAHNSMMNEAEKPENAAKKDELAQKAKQFRSWSHNEDGSPKWKHPRDTVDLIACPKVLFVCSNRPRLDKKNSAHSQKTLGGTPPPTQPSLCLCTTFLTFTFLFPTLVVETISVSCPFVW